MSNEWFYEYEGKKHGPVSPETLRHLAKHGAIVADTRIWKVGVASPAPASRIKNLLPTAAVAEPAASRPVQNETVREYLQLALEATRDEDEERLKSVAPPLNKWDSYTISSILLEYDIQGIERLPTPIMNADTPSQNRTKPVRQLFRATVKVVVCDRPNHGGSLADIRRLAPGRSEKIVEYECKEFEDGSWLMFCMS